MHISEEYGGEFSYSGRSGMQISTAFWSSQPNPHRGKHPTILSQMSQLFQIGGRFS